MRLITPTISLLLAALQLASADWNLNQSSDQDRKIRDRYKTILLRNLFRKRAFDRVPDSCAVHEGLDHWINHLHRQTYSEGTEDNANLILGQICDGQFNHADATRALKGVKQTNHSNYRILLGKL
ncbi:MAG: hypothetical protein ACPGVU_09060 [Limisphaerales bacterium]